jgi:hypothetical protein
MAMMMMMMMMMMVNWFVIGVVVLIGLKVGFDFVAVFLIVNDSSWCCFHQFFEGKDLLQI